MDAFYSDEEADEAAAEEYCDVVGYETARAAVLASYAARASCTRCNLRLF